MPLELATDLPRPGASASRLAASYAPPVERPPTVQLAPESPPSSRSSKSGPDPFAPPAESENLDLALDVAKPQAPAQPPRRWPPIPRRARAA